MARKSKLLKPTAFQWFSETINWEVFQRISLHLYGAIFDDHFAEEYLVRGMFQDGIDIISFKKGANKSATLQCKYQIEISLPELKEIVNLFLASSFLKSSDVFIITTTANIQETRLKKYIFEQIAYFRDTYDIRFDCWGVDRLETELKKKYLLVEHYFGPYEAERFCFEPAFRKIAYAPVSGFIERNLKDMKAEPDLFPWMSSDRKTPQITLPLLFINGEEKKRLVGIIAEAYEGKSTLLRQAAYEIAQYPQTVPLFLDLKGCVIQPIPNLLDIQFSTWKSVPARNLVVLIDGLDEVATDDLLDAISHIRDLKTLFPSLRVAVSCRKLYYSNYNLSTELPDFAFYSLVELYYGQIIRYADAHTEGNGQAFYGHMESKGVSLLLANPFYLTKLIGWYIDPKGSIPETKVDIALKLVDESFNISATRRISKGKQLAHNKVRLKLLLQQLALAFQINGTNSGDEELIQQLFTSEDTILLKHSSVLDIEKDKWMFTNAFFQEQLAAMSLQKYTVEEVIGLITVGEQIKKIKTKWIQTIATYLSMFTASDSDRQKLLEVIEQDNIELVAKSEGSTFLPAFKVAILKKIIERTTKLQSRLVLISEHEIADFIGNEQTAVDYLLAVIEGPHINITKEVCCHILKSVKLNQQQANAYTIVAKSQLPIATNKYFARLLLEGISYYKSGDNVFLTELLQKTKLLKEHEFRQGVYKFLEAHRLVTDYYDFVLDGLEVLYAHNSSITHSGSELRIKKLLLSTSDPDQLKKLLLVIAGDRFHSFFRFKSEETNEFLEKLQDRLVIAYEKDPSIIYPVVDCVVAFGLKRVDDEFRGMNIFFERTNTYLEGLKAYLERPSENRRTYDFSDHLSRDCFGYLIESCQSGLINRHELDSFTSGLSHAGRNDEANELRQLTRKAFGEPNPAVKKRHDLYAKAATNKAENDLKYITSAASFEEGILLFFKALKKERITLKELYNHEDRMTRLINVYSDFIGHLMHEVVDDHVVTLDACLELIQNEKRFRVFRIKSLMDHRLGKKYEEPFLALLKSYYLTTINDFPFSSVNNDSDYYDKVLATQYLKIWNKYQLETADDILLEFIRMDGEGINFIHMSEVNRRDSVALHLIDYFERNGKIEVFKTRVLDNLKAGIGNHSVLGTHIELSRHLHIAPAAPYVLKAVYSDFRPYSNEYAFMDIFAALGGDLSELLPLFEGIEDFEDYTFIHLTKLLAGRFSEIVEKRLMAALNSYKTGMEKKREIARYLAELGNKDGFQFIIDELNPQEATPYSIQSNWSVWNVDTAFGLELLEPFIFTLVDDTLPKYRFQDSVDHLLLELLRGFASKSEKDLQMVVELMTRKSAAFATTYPLKYGQLLWYAQQMEESFRKSSTDVITVSAMKILLAKILN